MNTKIVDDLSIKMMETDPEYALSDNELIKQIERFDNIDSVDRDGRTLLISSAFYNRVNILNYLIENGADICARDKMGISALHAAVISKNTHIVEILISKGIPVDIKDNFGNTPLMKAKFQDIECISLLLRHGADCKKKNNFGRSPYDIFEAYPEIIKLMDKTLDDM